MIKARLWSILCWERHVDQRMLGRRLNMSKPASGMHAGYLSDCEPAAARGAAQLCESAPHSKASGSKHGQHIKSCARPSFKLGSHRPALPLGELHLRWKSSTETRVSQLLSHLPVRLGYNGRRSCLFWAAIAQLPQVSVSKPSTKVTRTCYPLPSQLFEAP